MIYITIHAHFLQICVDGFQSKLPVCSHSCAPPVLIPKAFSLRLPPLKIIIPHFLVMGLFQKQLLNLNSMIRSACKAQHRRSREGSHSNSTSFTKCVFLFAASLFWLTAETFDRLWLRQLTRFHVWVTTSSSWRRTPLVPLCSRHQQTEDHNQRWPVCNTARRHKILRTAPLNGGIEKTVHLQRVGRSASGVFTF